MPDDVPTVDQAEARGDFLAAGLDVGADAGAAQAVEGGDELLVAAPSVLRLVETSRSIGFDVKRPVRLDAGVHLGDELADAVNQDVLVVDGRQAQRAGDDRDFHAVMLVFADVQVGLGGQREDGMLHRSHVVLGDGVGHVANEKILDRVTIRQEAACVLSCYYPP